MTTTVHTTSVGDLAALARSFERALRAANRSPRTIATYRQATTQLVAFLATQGMPTEAALYTANTSRSSGSNPAASSATTTVTSSTARCAAATA